MPRFSLTTLFLSVFAAFCGPAVALDAGPVAQPYGRPAVETGFAYMRFKAGDTVFVVRNAAGEAALLHPNDALQFPDEPALFGVVLRDCAATTWCGFQVSRPAPSESA